MAQTAWQGQVEAESDIVRRLVVRPFHRPLRESSAVLTVVPASEPEETGMDEGPSPDLLRLKTEMTLMKAVLKAQRSENAELRSQIEQAGIGSGENPRLVRDRWATLVDQLLRQPR